MLSSAPDVRGGAVGDNGVSPTSSESFGPGPNVYVRSKARWSCRPGPSAPAGPPRHQGLRGTRLHPWPVRRRPVRARGAGCCGGRQSAEPLGRPQQRPSRRPAVQASRRRDRRPRAFTDQILGDLTVANVRARTERILPVAPPPVVGRTCERWSRLNQLSHSCQVEVRHVTISRTSAGGCEGKPTSGTASVNALPCPTVFTPTEDLSDTGSPTAAPTVVPRRSKVRRVIIVYSSPTPASPQ